MMIDDYLAEHAALRGRFGPACKLVLLFQVGSFYEIYAPVDDPENDPTGIYAVADLLNIAVTRKSKAVPEVSRANPLLAGIPVAAFAKYRPVLLNADYTVAIANQGGGGADGKFTRTVDEVLSPGTWDGENAGDASGRGTLLCVAWVDARSNLKTGDWIGVGVAGIDLSTGGAHFAEVNATGRDAGRALDEARSILRGARPRELVLVPASDSDVTAAALKRLSFDSDFGTLVHSGWRPPPEMARLAYQEAVIGKAFPADARGLLTPLEHVGLERSPLAAAAYATVLAFAYSHDERVLARLRPPSPWPVDGVTVASAEQLNITQGKGKALLPLLNTCKTAFGRRAFAARLCRPTRDVDVIEDRLNMVQRMLSFREEGGIAEKRYEAVRRELSGVHDLERLARRVALGRAAPHEVAALADSVGRAGQARVASGLSLGVSVAAVLAAFEGWDLDALRRGDLGTVAFRVSGDDAARAEVAELTEAAAEVARIAELTEAKDEGVAGGLTVTKRRFDAAIADGRVSGLAGVGVATGRVRLAHPAIDRREACARALEAANRAAFERLVALIASDAVANEVQALVQSVGEIDVAAAVAETSARHGYCRPTVLPAGLGFARLRARGLRHPIVERLLVDEPFTANDVDLGGDDGEKEEGGESGEKEEGGEKGEGKNKKERGLLVYGLNMVGKTTVMKSLGCAVIMAQAGMHVAAEAFELRPFDAVYTRIAGGDDLFSGQSSFAVEMAELRNILRRATADSLVLGDELACTTENVSAIAVVAQGIVSLAARGCCFVLTSHLHGVTGVACVRELIDARRVRVAHMHVDACEDGTLVYDRRMRDGQGMTLYGLEVARALGMGDDFMAGADAVRRELMGVPEHIVAPRSCRYNAGVYVDTCFLCGKAADEVHHLRERATADAAGFIADAGHHMNAAFNLVAICKACHLAQHHGADAKKNRLVKTTKGSQIL